MSSKYVIFNSLQNFNSNFVKTFNQHLLPEPPKRVDQEPEPAPQHWTKLKQIIETDELIKPNKMCLTYSYK